jgi:hypothetical protein
VWVTEWQNGRAESLSAGEVVGANKAAPHMRGRQREGELALAAHVTLTQVQ